MKSAGRVDPKFKPADKQAFPNVSTTKLRKRGSQQCLPFSRIALRGKHHWHPIAVMGVVDMFRH